MKHYIVTGRTLDLPSGVVVELSPDQFRRRSHVMVPVQKLPDVWARAAFAAKGPIQFKHGELVGTAHDLGKSAVQEVIPVKEGADPALAAEEVKKAAQPAEKQKGKGFLKEK